MKDVKFSLTTLSRAGSHLETKLLEANLLTAVGVDWEDNSSYVLIENTELGTAVIPISNLAASPSLPGSCKLVLDHTNYMSL